MSHQKRPWSGIFCYNVSNFQCLIYVVVILYATHTYICVVSGQGRFLKASNNEGNKPIKLHKYFLKNQIIASAFKKATEKLSPELESICWQF